ncbi:MAG: phosphoribosylglycinamide formyltransferase, partial [Sphaerochaetaceae bacterium]|nr:phosphoribosylglycinamide formyltransferase [Sphaerochaetaceae bacterium]
EEEKIDLIVLAGYMRLLSPAFVNRYRNRIINIHPSLLPLYKGKDAIRQAFEDGRDIYGVTVHYVDEGMDDGQIIEQVRVPYEGTDIRELEAMVHAAEYELYPRVIQDLVDQGGTI